MNAVLIFCNVAWRAGLFTAQCQQHFPCTQPDLVSTAAQVAILHLYNVVNKRLPGWQEPPTRVRIKAALAEFDTNHDSVLNKQVR